MATPAADVPLDRIALFWRARWRILAAVGLVAALTTLGSLLVPRVYQSSAQIMIKVPATSQDGVLASSGLAAQYAEVAVAAPVIDPAARRAGLDAGTLAAHTSAGTVGGQNLIQVTVQWGSRSAARRAADAVAGSLVAYIQAQVLELTKSYQTVVDTQLAPLDTQIASVQRRVLSARQSTGTSRGDEAALADLTSAQTLLTSLIDRRSALAAESALQRASLNTQAQLIGAAGPAAQVQPRPLLYGLVAAVLAVLVCAQVVVVRARNRAAMRPTDPA